MIDDAKEEDVAPEHDADELSKTEAKDNGDHGSDPEETRVTLSQEEYDALKASEAKTLEWEDKFVREHAELENYKRRMRKEKSDFMKFALEDMMQDLITILDNFERAESAISDSKDVKGVVDGVTMIHQQLLDMLKKRGLEPIEAKGKQFDPQYHEAIGTIEHDAHEENTIVEECHRGYLFNGRLLRPSAVQIVAASPQTNQDQKE